HPAIPSGEPTLISSRCNKYVLRASVRSVKIDTRQVTDRSLHMARKTPRNAAHRPTPSAIRRAVASSTAIETGQSIEELERKLRDNATNAPRLPAKKPQYA